MKPLAIDLFCGLGGWTEGLNGKRRSIDALYVGGKVVAGDGIKQGGSWFHDSGPHALRRHSSKSSARKQASAMIAKIPIVLSRHIAKVYFPTEVRP